MSWYLQAYCLERNDFRTFKLSRINDLDALGEHFAPRPFQPAPLGKEPFYGKKWTTITLKVTHKIKDQLTDKFGQLNFLRAKKSVKRSLNFLLWKMILGIIY
ncbi:WYL domain-containing protein [Enterococcus termitis]